MASTKSSPWALTDVAETGQGCQRATCTFFELKQEGISNGPTRSSAKASAVKYSRRQIENCVGSVYRLSASPARRPRIFR